jgi:hypothetical protein
MSSGSVSLEGSLVHEVAVDIVNVTVLVNTVKVASRHCHFRRVEDCGFVHVVPSEEVGS